MHATLKGFIDRKGIGDALDKKERTVLARAGGYARTTMSRGMRRKKGSAIQGGYPNAHVGDLRKRIFFNYRRDQGDVIVGPEGFGSQPDWLPSGIATVPQLLNEGATVRRVIKNRPVTQVYGAFPFVDLTLTPAAAQLAKLYQTTPLKK